MKRIRNITARGLAAALIVFGVMLAAVCVPQWLAGPSAQRPGTILATSAWGAETLAASEGTSASANKTKPTATKASDAKASDAKSRDSATSAAQGLFATDPLRTLATALQERQRQLDDKEAQLKQTEQRLEATRKEIEQNLAQVDQIYKQMTKAAAQADEQQKAELKKWVKIYEAMTPVQAGQVLQDLDVSLAKQLLASMDPKKAAKIMNTIPSDKAIKMGEVASAAH